MKLDNLPETFTIADLRKTDFYKREILKPMKQLKYIFTEIYVNEPGDANRQILLRHASRTLHACYLDGRQSNLNASNCAYRYAFRKGYRK